jgi:hypothetical protein
MAFQMKTWAALYANVRTVAGAALANGLRPVLAEAGIWLAYLRPIVLDQSVPSVTITAIRRIVAGANVTRRSASAPADVARAGRPSSRPIFVKATVTTATDLPFVCMTLRSGRFYPVCARTFVQIA